MAQPEPIGLDEFRAIFGIDADNVDDLDGSDIDFEGFSIQNSDEEVSDSELESNGDHEMESDAESESEDDVWSEQLEDFVVEGFSGTQQITANIPEDAQASFFFGLLFTDELIDRIVNETNKYARAKLVNKPEALAKWKDTNRVEMKAFFGLTLIMGINNLPQLALYWSNDPFIGNTGIKSVMTKNRFEELAQYLHFNDSSAELKRGDANYDRLYKVRPVLNSVLEKAKSIYEPSKCLSVDEGMIAFKGRLAFRQYLPAKPTKYGIKVWMAADASNGYVVNFDVYLGSDNGKQRIHGLGYDVVMKMAEPFLNKNRHVFCDNFFTSTRLFEHLHDQNTYACGTVRPNRKDLPPCSKNKLKQGEVEQAQKGTLVYTKWHDKKDVSFLSTNVSPMEAGRQVERTVRGQRTHITKQKVADVYTANMGGVDRADQLRSFYASGWQSCKWYKYLFWFAFNLSVSNAFVLENFYRSSQGKTKRALLPFKRQLAGQLINGFSQRKRAARGPIPTGPSRAVSPADHVSVCVEGRKRTCMQCSKMKRKTPKGHRVETSYECKICKVALCRSSCHNEFHSD